MKFITTIPKCFSFHSQNERGAFIFYDHKSDLIKLIAPKIEIHNRLWAVLLSEEKNKAANSEYPIRLRLKLFPIDYSNENLPKATIVREIYKGKFASSKEPTQYFFAQSLNDIQWLTYSVYR